MDNLRRNFLIAALAACALVVSLRLDLLLAHNIRSTEALVPVARFFSLVGNGGFLAGVAVLLYAIGLSSRKEQFKEAGKTGLFALLAGGLTVHILKSAFERPRIEHGVNAVLTLLENPSLSDLTGRFNSFPSGHTAVSFALAAVLSKRFPRLMAPLYIIAALVGASRVYLGSHYPSDVVAGALLGLAIGWLVDNQKDRRRLALSALVLITLFISFFKTGGFLLFDVDEAVFSEAAREMVETGDLITPTYNYEPRYDKPILIYWLMSAAFKLFGTGEFAARFTSGLFGTFSVLATFFFIRRIKGLAPAMLCALALLLNLEYFVYTHSAVTDMTLGFFIASSIYAFYLGFHEDDPRWYWGFWCASALAVLTKGAIGLLFPVAVSTLFMAASGNKDRIKALFRPAFIAVFFAITVPWFAAQFYVNGWDFFNAFIIKHHIQRYSEVISSHSGPFYYYIGVLLLGFFPWVAFLPASVYRAFKERLTPGSGLYLLTAIWFLFVLIFFSIAKTKLPNYIFPLYAPAAILAGLALNDICEKNGFHRKSPLYISMILSAVFAAAMFILPSLQLRMDIPFDPGFFYTLGAIFSAVAVFSLAAFSKPLKAYISIAGVMVFFLVFLRLYGLPAVNTYLQKTLYRYSVYAREAGVDTVLATYELNKPSIAFYSRGKGVKIEKDRAGEIAEYAKDRGLIIITTPSKYEDIKGTTALEVLDAKDGFMLLGAGKLPPFK